MGIQINLEAFGDTNAEANKKVAYRKKIQILSAVLVLSALARIFIKNPPPPQPIVYTNENFRALPGVLATLSETDKKKFTPTQLAMFEEADRKFAQNKKSMGINLAGEKKPASVSTTASTFSYQKQVKPLETKPWQSPSTGNTEPAAKNKKDTVVIFGRGGAIRAESVTRTVSNIIIRIDKTMEFQIPKYAVVRIIENAGNWSEPLSDNTLSNKK